MYYAFETMSTAQMVQKQNKNMQLTVILSIAFYFAKTIPANLERPIKNILTTINMRILTSATCTILVIQQTTLIRIFSFAGHLLKKTKKYAVCISQFNLLPTPRENYRNRGYEVWEQKLIFNLKSNRYMKIKILFLWKNNRSKISFLSTVYTQDTT